MSSKSCQWIHGPQNGLAFNERRGSPKLTLTAGARGVIL
jgi:hypothetical protein